MTERNWDREKYTQVAVEEVSRSPAQLFLMLGSPEHFLATQCSNFMSTASCPFSSVFFSLCLYGDQYFPVPTPLCQSTGFLEALLLQPAWTVTSIIYILSLELLTQRLLILKTNVFYKPAVLCLYFPSLYSSYHFNKYSLRTYFVHVLVQEQQKQ